MTSSIPHNPATNLSNGVVCNESMEMYSYAQKLLINISYDACNSVNRASQQRASQQRASQQPISRPRKVGRPKSLAKGNKELGHLQNVPATCPKNPTTQQSSTNMPVIHSVASLASAGEDPSDKANQTKIPQSSSNSEETGKIEKDIPQNLGTQTFKGNTKETIIKVFQPKEVRNKAVMTRPVLLTKSINCTPTLCHKQTQSDFVQHPALVPIGVPCYMPIPLPMYQRMYPVMVPVPIPIPVPILVPTTRNSYKGIIKQVHKIREKIPNNPLEAQMLSLAGGLDDITDSDDSLPDTSSLSPCERKSKRKRRPLLDLIGPALDLENDIKQDSVVRNKCPRTMQNENSEDNHQEQKNTQELIDNKRRHSSIASSEDSDEKHKRSSKDWNERKQIAISENDSCRNATQKGDSEAVTQAVNGADSTNSTIYNPNKALQEKPDAKYHLKFTYGVNAWRHWVAMKNIELEKAREEGKYMKYFETDLLKLRADELNYTLCIFVKEVKKPNGDAYAADSILYLTYGIQAYLFENNRIDSIFTDEYYGPFTSAMHEVVKDFQLPRNELGYYVTRIEEEHLWEAKQLGAHSPQVLLNTLVYFNTKYYMLRKACDHYKLTFSQFIKHWKKGQKEGQKTVILRYCPLYKKGSRNDERKSLEQHENVRNPLRCPVKLYEFYLSKCPQSSKTQNDVFYLVPERSCEPDSPVWYSSSPLTEYDVDKMLQRTLMIREVQEHMLANTP